MIEYAGPAIEALSMEGRMTVCNMTIEAGGRAGMIAPGRHDLRLGRGPRGRARRELPDEWRELHTDDGARVRQGGRRRRRRAVAAGHLGHDARDGRAGHRARARAARPRPTSAR